MAPAPTPVATPAFRVAAAKLIRLPDRQLPYQGYAPISLARPPYPTDAHGIRVVIRAGVRHYSPVALAQQGVALLDSYAQTRKRAYLDLAIRVAAKERSLGVRVGAAVFLAYDADFNMHGSAREVLRAPWHSGMAQGLAISFFLRMASATNDHAYLTTATALVAAIDRLRVREDRPWVSTVDSARYLWIEEYPRAHDHTLNGYLFAMFGLYEYWLATGSRTAERLFDGGVATLRHYLPQFRNPGGISFYCLKHHVRSAGYHRIHVRQLRLLGRMTGDVFFTNMSAAFARDFS